MISSRLRRDGFAVKKRPSRWTLLRVGPSLVAALSVLVLCLTCFETRRLATTDRGNARIPVVGLEKVYVSQIGLAPIPENATETKRYPTNATYKGGNVIRKSDFPPAPPSPYELRQPGYLLPEWAKKPFFYRVPIPPEKRVCFVHIGKTAGSTVGCSLGFQLHCDMNLSKYPHWLLPKYTFNTIHNGVNDCPDDPAYYLFVMRNPLERLRSAYVYDRPEEDADRALDTRHRFDLYFDCPFFTLNDLAEQGLAENGTASDLCKQRAYNAVRGLERFGYHLYFNYNRYTNATLTDWTKHALAIRTEYLEEDWNSAERVLGGSGKDAHFPTYNKAVEKQDADRDPLTPLYQAVVRCTLSRNPSVQKPLAASHQSYARAGGSVHTRTHRELPSGSKTHVLS